MKVYSSELLNLLVETMNLISGNIIGNIIETNQIYSGHMEWFLVVSGCLAD